MVVVNNVDLMMIFGFEHPDYFSRDEFYYFLDSFFAGVFSLLVCKNHKMPHLVGYRLKEQDV